MPLHGLCRPLLKYNSANVYGTDFRKQDKSHSIVYYLFALLMGKCEDEKRIFGPFPFNFQMFRSVVVSD